MNASLSRYGDLPVITPDPDTPRPTQALTDLLYDGFYLIFLLQGAKSPASAAGFVEHITGFLDAFEHQARRANFSAEDIYDAKYAFCATVDETILCAPSPVRDDWERHPLQLALFGDQLAGEHFFDRLEQARQAGARRLPALEVFHLCLLLGFKGRYRLEGPEKLGYFITQLGEQIAHIKGRRAPFAPHWAIPDRIAHTLKRGVPVWVLAALFALSGLLAFGGLKSYAGDQTAQAMAPYQDIVRLAPKAPHLTITLP